MIVIRPYRADWPAEFGAIRQHLAEVLGERALRISHIGSTAVPGLAAKDIVDIQVGVADLGADVEQRLSRAGYEYIARHAFDHVPPGATGPSGDWRKLYFHGRPGQRECHIHVRVFGSPNHRYALLFRDYLRAHPVARESLERVKRELARLHANDADAYYAVKDPVCDLVWQAAGEWAMASGWRPETAAES